MFKKKMKQIGAMAMAASMILGSVQLPPLNLNAADNTNLALSATATASNSENGNGIAKINDGNLSTRWAHDVSDTSWAQLAWNETKTMKSFVIYWERNNAVNYALQVSDDGENWRDVYTATQAPATTTDEITLNTAVTGKFLRLNVTKIEPTNGGVTWNAVSVYELQVYEGDLPDDRTQATKIADSMTAPTVTADTTEIPMPDVPDGYSVEFDADYEQIIGRDGKVYKPLQTKTVKGFYEVTNEDGSDKAQSAEFTITVPGQYTDTEDANAKPDVIPALQEWHGESGDFVIQSTSKIVYADGLEATAKQFAADYKDITGNAIQTVKGSEADAKKGDFYLTLNSTDQGLDKEGYIMTIGDSVKIEAEEATGAYWGVISALQILKQNKTTIPKGITRDYPKYEVRGFMLDVGRKSFDFNTVKEFAKNMAWYKMNNFHLHLSDNLIFLEDYPTMQEAIDNAYAGFRLESAIPNLTSKDTYYTKDEFRSFIKDSRTMGVSIVPEFDMPAHALAITRAFPSLMTKEAGGNHSYLIEELDIRKDGALDAAKSVWAQYFEGDDPVFDKDTTVHIGTDEFHGSGGNEYFRSFSDSMIKYIQGTGRNVRMWGSLSNKNGTTPVASENVQLNIWNTGYANPKNMYDLGYDLINTLEGSLYIVPSAGYYSDYLNSQSLYNNWVPNNFSGTVLKAGDKQVLGGTYAIWNDQIDTRGNGITEYDDFDRFFQPLPSLSEKMWGEGTDRTYAQMRAVAEKVDTAPNTNPYYEADSVGKDVLEYSFDDKKVYDESGNNNDSVSMKNVEEIAGKSGNAVKLNGKESYVETPVDMVGPTSGEEAGASISMWVKRDADSDNSEQVLCETNTKFNTYAIKAVQKNTGKVGFSREGYDYSFDYELPKDEWVYLTINGYKDKAELYVNNKYVSSAALDNETKTTGSKVATLVLPVEYIGSKINSFKGLVDELTVSADPTTVSESGNALSRAGWTVSACSQESSEGSAQNAIDGDDTTFWHTNWRTPDVISGTHKHYFEVTLPEVQTISRLSCLPRQNSANGRIFKYDIVVTKADGTETTVVTDGTWANDTAEKFATFDPIEAKKVKLVIKDAGSDNAGKHGTIAELNLYAAYTKADLQTAYNSYANYKSEDYTGKSWAFFADALANAKTVLDDANSTAAKYSQAYASLQNTASQLESVKDKLTRVFAGYQNLDVSGYSKTSVANYQKKLKEVEDLLKNGNATGTQYTAALTALKEAKAALVDLSELKAAIAHADTVKTDDCTQASASTFAEALKTAKTVLTKEDATQENVDNALTALQQAETNLVKAGDKTQLTTEIADAEKVDKNAYTEESYAKFETALNEAKAVLADKNATQADVNAALQKLKDAKDALKEKGTTPDTKDDTKPTPDTKDDTKPTPNPTPGNNQTASVPAKGSKFTDKKTGLVYKVTRSDAKNGTVTVTGTTAAKKNAKKVTIPATAVKDGYTFKVTAISAKAFQNRKKLSSVVIGANVTKIGAKAFFKDAKLKSITFKGNKAVKAGKNAFKGIKANAKVTVPYKISKKNLNKIKKALKSAGKKVVIKKKDIVIPY